MIIIALMNISYYDQQHAYYNISRYTSIYMVLNFALVPYLPFHFIMYKRFHIQNSISILKTDYLQVHILYYLYVIWQYMYMGNLKILTYNKNMSIYHTTVFFWIKLNRFIFYFVVFFCTSTSNNNHENNHVKVP